MLFKNFPNICFFSFSQQLFGYGSLISAATYSFNTKFEEDKVNSNLNAKLLLTFVSAQVKTFYLKHQATLGTGKRLFQQAVEKIASNVQWVQKNKANVTKWLKNKSNSRAMVQT